MAATEPNIPVPGKIPQLSDEGTILQPVRVESEAQGHEAFAKTLAGIAGEAFKKTEEIVTEQSNAMLLKSAAQMETAKANSQIEMIKNPESAEKISLTTASILDKITQDSFVNDKDRLKLQTLAGDNYNSLRVHAAQVEYQQSQRSASISFWDNYPAVMKGIQDALVAGDFKKAKLLEDSLHQSALNAAQIGAISPEQFSNINKTNFDLYERAKDINMLASHPDGGSAEDFHAVVQSPFNTNTANNVSFPVNAKTHYVASSYNFDRTMQGQYSNLYGDKPLNYGVLMNATPHEYEEFKSQMMGVSQVKGAIQSGLSFSQIDERMKALNSKPKLSPMETGEVNYWKSFKYQMEHGNGYIRLMSQTTLGGRYTQEYNQNDVAIKNSAKNDAEKFNALRENDNNYISHMVSLGQSQNLDANYIHPVPMDWVNQTQRAFVKDAPVTEALARISYLKPENRPYLANSMEKQNQAVAVYLAGATMVGDQVDTTFQAQLLEANQSRDYSSLLKTGKDETKDTDIWDDISSDSDMKNIYGYFGRLPGGNSAQNGLKEAAVNYVLYRAAKEGDVNISGKSKYETDFIINVKKGFNLVNGNRYVFNGNTLNIRQTDMDFIANYALAEAYRHIHAGRSEHEFQSYIDLNPLLVTNTPDNRIVVIDKSGHAAVDINGKNAFDMPYTQDMLAYSHKHHDETKKYMETYSGIPNYIVPNQSLLFQTPFLNKKENK